MTAEQGQREGLTNNQACEGYWNLQKLFKQHNAVGFLRAVFSSGMRQTEYILRVNKTGMVVQYAELGSYTKRVYHLEPQGVVKGVVSGIIGDDFTGEIIPLRKVEHTNINPAASALELAKRATTFFQGAQTIETVENQ